MYNTDHRPASRQRSMLWMSLSCLALVAGCGGEDGQSLSYLSPFGAPGPVDSSVLSDFFANAMLQSVITQTANLLANDVRYTGQWTNGWDITLDSGQNITGLESYPLKTSGAAFAHAAGLTGSGSKIAVSDGQFITSTSYPEFAGKVIDIVNNWQNLFPSNGPATAHGTIVSAVALGSSGDFIGTAPGADLIFGSYETDEKLAAVGQAALAQRAVAWNNSWGYPSLGLNQQDFDAAFAVSQGSIDYLAALDAYAAYGVVVFAASNDDTLRNSTLLDGLPYMRPSLEAGWIAAVNGVPTFSGQNVSSVQLLSSACYEAARWCLIADGGWQIPDLTLQLPGSFTLVTGSSFAAPQISGGLALLEQAFPSLSPHELRVRLLASADDGFFSKDAYVELADGFSKGYSFTYGHGFLDIEAALKPIGGTAMSLSDGGVVATNAPVLRTGTGFGDAVELALAGTDVRVRDALSAGFVMPAGALTTSARPGSRATALLSRDLSTDLAQRRRATETALSDPFADFGGNTVSLSAPDGLSTASVLLPQPGGDSAGVNLTRALTEGSTRLELGLKLARDNGQVMSLNGDGANMASVSLGLTQDFGANAFLALSGEVGISDLGGATALGTSGSARFDSAALTLGRSNVLAKGDRLTIGVAMPVAVASGETTLDLPVYREAAAAGFAPVAIDLAPDSRQLDLEVSYQAALSEGLEMKLSVAHSDNFGNREGQTDTGGTLALTFRF